MTQKASDFGQSFANGLLSFVGLGMLYDPIGDMRSELASQTQEMNEMVAKNTILALSAQEESIENLYKFINSKTQLIAEINKENNEALWNSIQRGNMFTITLSILVFVTIFFVLTDKKCC